MAEVFRCDYCGQWRALRDAQIWYVQDGTNEAGDVVFTVAVGCGAYCAREMANVRVGGR